MACLTGVMKRGAVTPFLEATEALVYLHSKGSFQIS